MRLVLLAAAAALAGCGPPEDPRPAPAAPPPPAAPAEVAGAGTALPPADAAFRYVGRWARAETACGHAAWDFRERSVDSPGARSCLFDKVDRAPGGYDIAATCEDEGARAASELSIRFAESARAMLVEGGPFDAPVGLVWCGPG